ncbi:MAG: MBL fold metallo-hydrolase [Rhodocyclaceae bacterium]|jgi:7,8-dihydropterin-6-yl-methyl-4-(beta-D-ribofuranosyl)aminobenzene 5'-phosphate synthase|nr:MAG: MBL fold metallo-hydrolase [Rhodocyclaceae bacterium]
MKLLSALLAALLVFPTVTTAQDIKRITTISDAFGAPSALRRDWGYASFVEYGGKRILFDTGNSASVFAHNVKALGIDLTRVDAVVISHRHGDHTSGLNHLLEVNPGVRIYVPREGAFFKGQVPRGFLQTETGLPPEMRYFDGQAPDDLPTGTPWEKGNFETVQGMKEIFPGFFVLSSRSQKPGTMEMNELSLALMTPRGLAIVVGCSHPGIDLILQAAVKIDPRIYTVMGGFHLVMSPREEVVRVADALQNTLKVERVAPGHCTSELGFSVLLDRYKDRFDRAGVGSIIALP